MIGPPRCLGEPCLCLRRRFNMAWLRSRIGRLFVLGVLIMAWVGLLTQCRTPPKNYRRKMPPHIKAKIGKLAPRGIEDSLETPPHTFSREEYPFDDRGRYREEWVSGEALDGWMGSLFGSGSSESGERPRPSRHEVKKGDTLFGLSRRYGVTVHALRSLNGLPDVTIRVGQVLRIPGS